MYTNKSQHKKHHKRGADIALDSSKHGHGPGVKLLDRYKTSLQYKSHELTGTAPLNDSPPTILPNGSFPVINAIFDL